MSLPLEKGLVVTDLVDQFGREDAVAILKEEMRRIEASGGDASRYLELAKWIAQVIEDKPIPPDAQVKSKPLTDLLAADVLEGVREEISSAAGGQGEDDLALGQTAEKLDAEVTTVSGDLVAWYLKEIGVVPQLTRNEQVWLAMKIRSGDKIKALLEEVGEPEAVVKALYQQMLEAWDRVKEEAKNLGVDPPELSNILREAGQLASGYQPETSYFRDYLNHSSQAEWGKDKRWRRLAKAISGVFEVAYLMPQPVQEKLIDSSATQSIPDREEFLAWFGELGQEQMLEGLTQAVLAGQESLDLLISSNLKLVVSVARRFLGRGVPIEDLIQEGNLGLMKACQKYDPCFGTSLSTYATWWIHQAIGRAVANYSRPIRLPVYVHTLLSRINRFATEFLATEGREPTKAEIALELGFLEPDQVNKIKQAQADGVPLEKSLQLAWQKAREKVAEYLRWLRQEPISLQQEVGSEDSELADFLAAEGDLSFEDLSLLEEIKDEIREALNCLNDQERRVLQWRFGLDGGEGMTLAAIGAELGLTRERVRQIEAGALRNLRHPTRTRRLRQMYRDLQEGPADYWPSSYLQSGSDEVRPQSLSQAGTVAARPFEIRSQSQLLPEKQRGAYLQNKYGSLERWVEDLDQFVVLPQDGGMIPLSKAAELLSGNSQAEREKKLDNLVRKWALRGGTFGIIALAPGGKKRQCYLTPAEMTQFLLFVAKHHPEELVLNFSSAALEPADGTKAATLAGQAQDLCLPEVVLRNVSPGIAQLLHDIQFVRAEEGRVQFEALGLGAAEISDEWVIERIGQAGAGGLYYTPLRVLSFAYGYYAAYPQELKGKYRSDAELAEELGLSEERIRMDREAGLKILLNYWLNSS